MDRPAIESRSWKDVYKPNLTIGEEFRMVNWDTAISLADTLHPAVRGQIMSRLNTVQGDDEEGLIAERNKAIQYIIFQVYGSECRALQPVDKQGNPTEPSPLGFPLAVRFKKKKW